MANLPNFNFDFNKFNKRPNFNINWSWLTNWFGFVLVRKAWGKAQELFYHEYHISVKDPYYAAFFIGISLFLYESFRFLGEYFSGGLANMDKYASTDIWYYPFRWLPIPGQTLVMTIPIFAYVAYGWYMDTIGGPSPLRNLGKAKPSKHQYNWLHLLTMVFEGFTFGVLIYTFLPLITDWFITLFAPSAPYLDNVPNNTKSIIFVYETSFLQNVGLAFGSGFYEEYLFHVLLLQQANKYLAKSFPPQKQLMPYVSLTGKWQHYKLYSTTLLLSAVAYTVIHVGLGDDFTLYNSLYRFFFGLLLGWIMVRRKFAITMMTHTWTEIFFCFFGDVDQGLPWE
ncbi:MAG: type II CAAX prenyl endopeptidase Rce1 family protein [Bacteroidia bacterium]